MLCEYQISVFLYFNQEAECEKEKMDVAYQAQTNIADSSREFQMQKAAFDQEVNARKAESELAYELQVNSASFATFYPVNGFFMHSA